MDGCQILKLNNERFTVPELLIHPSNIGMGSIGIGEAIVKSILKCPKKQQIHLSQNIVLIGGNTNFFGYKERIYQEVRSNLPDFLPVKIYQPDRY